MKLALEFGPAIALVSALIVFSQLPALRQSQMVFITLLTLALLWLFGILLWEGSQMIPGILLTIAILALIGIFQSISLQHKRGHTRDIINDVSDLLGRVAFACLALRFSTFSVTGHTFCIMLKSIIMTPILKTIVYVAGLVSMAGMATAALCAAKAVACMTKPKQDETNSEKEQTSKA